MENINIISSIIDEYKEHFKDNDYKNLMDALKRMFNKINDDKSNNDDYDNFIFLLNNNEPLNFRYRQWSSEINFQHNGCIVLPTGLVCRAKDVYPFYFQKYFTFTNNENDIIEAKTLQNKLNLNFKQSKALLDYLRTDLPHIVHPINQFKKANIHYISGIKEKI